MRGDLERLAYESALRGLDKQEALLEELRARTGVLLAASSLAVSFLGQRAFEQPGPRGLAFVALGSFVVSVAASVFVLVPRGDFHFSVRGEGVYDSLCEICADIAEMHRRLARHLDLIWSVNDKRLGALARAHALGAVALVVEVLSMVALIGDILI